MKKSLVCEVERMVIWIFHFLSQLLSITVYRYLAAMLGTLVQIVGARKRHFRGG